MKQLLYKQHPIGKLLPPLSPERYEALRASLLKDGQQRAVQVYDGMILDGWHRYQILMQAGADINFSLWQGDPWKLICADAVRRGMDAGQIAFIFMERESARVASAQDAAAKRRSQNARKSTGATDKNEKATLPFRSVAAGLAKEIGVAERTVKDALVVHGHGTPAEKAAVIEQRETVHSQAKAIRKRRTTTKPKQAPLPIAEPHLPAVARDLLARLGRHRCRELIDILERLLEAEHADRVTSH